MQFSLNHHLLKADLRELSTQLRGLKRVLGTTWERPMANLQRELCRLKQRVTELCALSAFSRGRLHLRRPPRHAAIDWSAAAYHQRIAERLGPSYSLAPASLSTALERSA